MTADPSTGTFTSVTDQVRDATEGAIKAWQQGVASLAEQATAIVTLPVDLTEPVKLFLLSVQRTADLQREMTSVWMDLMAQMSGAFAPRSALPHARPEGPVGQSLPTLAATR